TIPETIATSIAVSTEAMILFHSNDNIDAPPIPVGSGEERNPPRQLNRNITLPKLRRTGHLVAVDPSAERRRDQICPQKPDHRHSRAARRPTIARQTAR